jgi:hypothetical protein
MKKHLSVLLVVLAVTAIFTTTVLAAPVNGKSVSLLSVEYQEGGIVLKFETSGLTQADLNNATFEAVSNYQDIYCTFVDGTTTVRCTVAKSLAGKGGFKVTLAGFIFWDDLPKERAFGLTCAEGEMLWYTYDVYIYGELEYSGGEVPAFIWEMTEADGLFEIWAAEYGETYEIAGSFCAPDFYEIPN